MLDSSFIVALYLEEERSDRALEKLYSQTNALEITDLSEVESLNAFQVQVFRGDMTSGEAAAAASNFRRQVQDGIFIKRRFSQEIFALAIQLAERHSARLGVRSLDILHVASALYFGADSFWSFDIKQNQLARAEGLKVLS